MGKIYLINTRALKAFFETGEDGRVENLFLQGDDETPLSAVPDTKMTIVTSPDDLFAAEYPWRFQEAKIGFDPLNINSGVKVKGHPTFELLWERLSFDFSPNRLSFTFKHLKLETPLIPNISIECDLHFVFAKQENERPVFQAAESTIDLYQPDADHTVPLALKSFTFDQTPFTLGWQEPNLNYWFAQLMPGFFDESAPVEVTPQLSIHNQTGALDKISLEWDVKNGPRTFIMPGLRSMRIPDGSKLKLLLGQVPGDLHDVTLSATLVNLANKVRATSNFAWKRGSDRELLNDGKIGNLAPALVEITIPANGTAPVTLMKYNPYETAPPRFLSNTGTPTLNLVFPNGTGADPIYSIGYETLNLLRKLDDDDLKYLSFFRNKPKRSLLTFTDFLEEKYTSNAPAGVVNPSPMPDLADEAKVTTFTFPFLNFDEPRFFQSIRLVNLVPATPKTGTNNLIDVKARVEVIAGDLKLNDLTIQETFDISTMAFAIVHNEGIQIHSDAPEWIKGSHMGLVWRFKPNNDKQLFTLITENYSYQLKQAEGAQIELDFTKASEEPLTFIVEDFVLTEKGISLTADVSDKPVRLNGIDARYRFENSFFQIVENVINDFSLAGSGPLPPDLVGEAIANITLQFQQQEDGAVALVSGTAELDKIDLLRAPLTRFEFAIDAIELLFVETIDVFSKDKLYTEVSADLREKPDAKVVNNAYHLYFNLSGTAQYVPHLTDDPNFPLAPLRVALITLESIPLAGNARVLKHHIDFLTDLPEKVEFNFLGVFTMEIRAFGFLARTRAAALLPAPGSAALPQGVNDALVPAQISRPNAFGDDPAMIISGQVFFSSNGGDNADTISSKVDFHGLYIGLPRPEKPLGLPRLHFRDLSVEIKFKETFALSATVSLIESLNETGFSGEGTMTVKDYTFAAAFAFLRVRHDELSEWKRAWFIFLEMRDFSVRIPYLNIFLREIGAGFGYRYTLASIKTADLTDDIAKLLAELRKLSRTQGDLSKRDRWSVDLEKEGEDPRWTIVLRALFSQTSAAKEGLKSDPTPAEAARQRAENNDILRNYAKNKSEKATKGFEEDPEAADFLSDIIPDPFEGPPDPVAELPCIFIMDAIIAVRSDLTFFMAARAWLNTNYSDYKDGDDEFRENPLLSGFVILSPRKKRFLAQLATNPEGQIGGHPPVPYIVRRALRNTKVSATLLIEPGLFHLEMGWPNMLTFSDTLGPLKVDIRAGFIFRVTDKEMVIGMSLLARGVLEISGGVDLGIVGVSVYARAAVAYGARYIAAVQFDDPLRPDDPLSPVVYGAIGLEMRIEFKIEFWIDLWLFSKEFTLSMTVGFTASLEIGLVGADSGLRGQGTLSVSIMGHTLNVSASFGLNEQIVDTAFRKTQKYLEIGLEATDVQKTVPGVEAPQAPPVAVDDAVSTPEGVPVTFDVLINDKDIDGDPLQLSIVSVLPAGAGQAALEALDAPSQRKGIKFAPAEEFNGSAQIRYRIEDGRGGTATARLTVAVLPVNDIPLAVDDAATTTQGEAVTVDVLANDKYKDHTRDQLIVTIERGPHPAEGEAAIDDKNIKFTPPDGFTGTVSPIVYRVSDGQSSATAIVSIVVKPRNKVPAKVTDGGQYDFTTNQNQPITIDAQANFKDPEGDPLTTFVSEITSDKPNTAGEATIVGLNGAIRFTPAPEFLGTAQIEYGVVDQWGGVGKATVTIKVEAVTILAGTFEGSTLRVVVLENVAESEKDQYKTTITKPEPDPVRGEAIVDGQHGINDILYTPAANVNTDTIDFKILDTTTGVSTPGTLTITVKPNAFNQPDYNIFVIHKPSESCSYFVLFPKGGEERGFLPVPPVSFVLDQGLVTSYKDAFENQDLSTVMHDLKSEFSGQGFTLDPQSTVAPTKPGEKWRISVPSSGQNFSVRSSKINSNIGEVEVLKVFLEATTDFTLLPPDNQKLDDLQLKQIMPDTGADDNDILQFKDVEGKEFSWAAHWDTPIIEASKKREGSNSSQPPVEAVNISLGDYLKYAFKTSGGGRKAVGDPDHYDTNNAAQQLVDDRVQNPTDDAFEAAVRGAIEQFQGSPFFKHDPNIEYDRALEAAYSDNTTIYAPSGTAPAASPKSLPDGPLREARKAEMETVNMNKGAHELRGMVIQDFVADLREYVAAGAEKRIDLAKKSIPFQMGLVFRVKVDNDNPMPGWLERPISLGNNPGPKIKQRKTAESITSDGEAKEVSTFNIAACNFSTFPPQFQNVRPYTNARSIALAWDLNWETPPEGSSGSQADPEHHLLHYQVRRRALDGRDPEQIYTVKNAETLQRDKNGLLKRLKPRFQIVDHFTHETKAELAALPVEGRSYLYTITPVDFAGNLGRPLSLVATRYPDEPPQVPADAVLTVAYQLTWEDSVSLEPLQTPPVIAPRNIQLTWSDPPAPKDAPQVPVAIRRLIFRKRMTLPLDSYGLDGAVDEPVTNALPTSNARPLPTDIKIEVEADEIRLVDTGKNEVTIENQALIDNGILPAGGESWRPEAWTVFIQTESVNGVPSALAPVGILLQAHPVENAGAGKFEERRPAHLEWLPRPITLPFLPPEDQRATVGRAHFPMPLLQSGFTLSQEGHKRLFDAQKDDQDQVPVWVNKINNRKIIDQEIMGREAFVELLERIIGADLATDDAEEVLKFTTIQPHAPAFDADLQDIAYRRHPAGTRCIRLRWNQGASQLPEYPLHLNAGYHLLRLDIDAHTTATFADKHKLNAALRQIQELQMLPAGDLVLEPGSTRSSSQWEAWYPSEMLRRQAQFDTIEGNAPPMASWYSWRDSILEWPQWPSLTTITADDFGTRTGTLHPFLQGFVDRLGGEQEDGGDSPFILDQQSSPPLQPGNLQTLMANTASKSDPYGWGILQRFGLSIAFTLRDRHNSRLVVGRRMLNAIQDVLDNLKGKTLFTGKTSEEPPQDMTVTYGELFRFLHIELLFQPGRSVRLETGAAGQEDLLALVQLSLRPAIRQYLIYGSFHITGPPGQSINLLIDYRRPESPCTLINLADPSSGEMDLEAAPVGEFISQSIRLSDKGRADVLIRARGTLPELGIQLSSEDVSKLPNDFFEDSDDRRQFKVAKLHDLTDEERLKFYNALQGLDRHLAKMHVTLPQTFPATDPLVKQFSVPANIADAFAKSPLELRQWLRFKSYAESLNSSDPTLEKEKLISVPVVDPQLLAAILPDFLTWAQRFFDASGEVGKAPVGNRIVTRTLDKRWLVTAYPISGTPTYITPDKNGRLKYDHLIVDKYAHNFRYFIRPYGRYDLLWQSFRQSRQLFPNVSTLPEGFRTRPQALPGVKSGGLDVVLDRIKPVSMPVVLSSARLDAESTSASPAPPGRTWEVIVARHAEQILSERNQTLFRRLSYRQIAFTLLRRFAFRDWIGTLKGMINKASKIKLKSVENQFPDMPDKLELDHLDIANLDAAEVRSLALPRRIGKFQQGAMILQWEALPYFYEHRLLLIAQTTDTVSPINEVIQRDFEYRSPDPKNSLYSGLESSWTLSAPFQEGKELAGVRTRLVEIPMSRFWDCLPVDAQAQWGAEMPDDETQQARNPKDGDANKRKLAALPDPEVIYQIVEFFSGNIEVQVEFYFDRKLGKFAIRQLGQTFLIDFKGVQAPMPEWPHADFLLRGKLLQITRVTLGRNYLDPNLSYRERIPMPTLDKLGGDVALSIAGVFEQEDRDGILHAIIRAVRADIKQKPIQDLFLSMPVGDYGFRCFTVVPDLNSGLPESTPEELALKSRLLHKIEYHELDILRGDLEAKRPYPNQTNDFNIEVGAVNWTGPIDADQLAALQAFQTSRKPYQADVRAAIQRLVEALQDAIVPVPYLAPSITLITLGGTAVNLCTPYTGMQVEILAGQGKGPVRTIKAYDSGVASVDRNWNPLPDSGAKYQVIAGTGAAQSAAQAGIRLDWAFNQDNIYNDMKIEIKVGPVVPQVRKIIAYDGAAKVATVNPIWDPLVGVPAAQIVQTGVVRDRTVVPGTNFIIITLATTAVDQDGFYNDWQIEAVNTQGVPSGQRFTITNYKGRSREASIPNSVPIPMLSVGANYKISRQIAQPPAHPSITLGVTAADNDQAYRDMRIKITEGPGAGQIRKITAYDGGSRVATVDDNWDKDKVPKATSQYRIICESGQVQAATNRVSKNQLSIQGGGSLEGLDLEDEDYPQQAIWRGLDKLERSIDDYKNNLLIDDEQTAEDPFFAVFSQLMDKIAGTKKVEDTDVVLLSTRLMRLTEPLSDSEKGTLKAAFAIEEDRLELEELFIDLEDRRTLEKVYQDWFSQVEVTQQPVLTSLTVPGLQSRLELSGPSAGTPATHTLRYHGLMTFKEAQAIKALFQTIKDQGAVQQLFKASLEKGLQGKQLKVRTRKGSAKPSGMQELVPKPIPEASN